MDRKVVLIADDDAAIRTVLNQSLMRAGFDVRVTSNVSTLWQWILDGQGHVVVSDVILPDGNGFDLLPRIQKERPNLPVILISAQNTLVTAIKAQEAGAHEYLPKPFDLDDLTRSVQRAVSVSSNTARPPKLSEQVQDIPLVGRSPAMQKIYRSIARLMNEEIPVLLSGPMGVGKGLIAQVLHDYGNRKIEVFKSIKLSALKKDEIEGRLFGSPSSKGLIEEVGNGTLYIEDINELPPEAQAGLLNHLLAIEKNDDGVPKTRIIASISDDTMGQRPETMLREDLFYRLSIVQLAIPALMDRIEDVADLARHFLRLKGKQDDAMKHIDDSALKALRQYHWPGNVRELHNLINRIYVLYPQETITDEVIKSEIAIDKVKVSTEFERGSEQFSSLKDATRFFAVRYFEDQDEVDCLENVYEAFLGDVEPPIITAALQATNGNQIKAAKVLGINRNTLRKKINLYKIQIVKTAR